MDKITAGRQSKSILHHNNVFVWNQEKLSETTEIVFGVCVLILVVFLVRKFHAWRIKRSYLFIIEDLKSNKAFDPTSAIDLPYARNSFLKMGLRDFRATALEHLILNNMVGISDNGKYYLIDKDLGPACPP